MIKILSDYPTLSINYPPSFTALPKGYSKVDDYLIRGPHPSIKDLWTLKQEGVNQVFDFRHFNNFGCKFIEKFACKILGISYKRLPYSYLHKEYPSLSVFENIAAKVKQNGENGGKTLFHCHSSRHRTSHFSAFYLLTKGEPLNVVAKMPDFEERFEQVVINQIIKKNYFNRTIKNYKGINPILKYTATLNDKIAKEVQQAHAVFMNIVNPKIN